MSTWDPAAPEALVEEATVDAYGEDEQVTGFFTMIEESLAVPFTTTVLGVEVSVVGVNLTEDGRVVAPRAGNGSRHTATGPAELARRTTARLSQCANGRSPRRPPTGPAPGNRKHVARIPQYAYRYG